jgi:hypothetical protein
MTPEASIFHGTTILSVRRGDRVAMGGDGQVTLGNIVVKASARKVRRLYHDRILAGFAGATADAFTLFERFAAAARVVESLQGAIADPRGRWVLGRHPESRFEYRLRVATPEGVRLVVIDRVFTDAAGDRWIVDYKTSFHEGADRAGFLDREVERYRAQLAGYAAALGGAPARLGLYFPLMREWRESRATEVRDDAVTE